MENVLEMMVFTKEKHGQGRFTLYIYMYVYACIASGMRFAVRCGVDVASPLNEQLNHLDTSSYRPSCSCSVNKDEPSSDQAA